MQQTITAATRLAGSLRQVDVHKFTNLNIVCENVQTIDLCSQSTGNCPCVFQLLGSNKLYQMNISSMLKYKLWWDSLFFKFKVFGLCSHQDNRAHVRSHHCSKARRLDFESTLHVHKVWELINQVKLSYFFLSVRKSYGPGRIQANERDGIAKLHKKHTCPLWSFN